jgi:hypothetical protein
MKVEITITGHQSHRVITGEVISHGYTVEMFKDMPFSVPCIVVDDGERIKPVPLRMDLHGVVVKKLEDTK